MQRLEEIKKLQDRKSELFEAIKNINEEVKAIDAKLSELFVEEKGERDAKEKAERKDAYERFQNGADHIYDIFLRKLQESYSYTVTRGRKWDTFFYDRYGTKMQKFKVERSTGNIYHTGKHPKGNIIRDLFSEINW